MQYSGAVLAAWTIAWLVAGFGVLPYLTVVPAGWVLRQGQQLSTAEFVTAVLGLLIGLLMGLLLGLPLSNIGGPLGEWLPLGVSLFLGLGMVGLTVAKRADLMAAAETIGLFRRPSPEGEANAREGEPHIVVDTSAIIDGRIAEIVESGLHLRDARRAALRARRAPAHRRQLGHAPSQPRPARPGDPVADAEGRPDAGRDRRGALPGHRRGRRQARRARQDAQPGDPDQRLQPQPGGRAAGDPGAQHQLAGQRREARPAARRGPPGPDHPGGQGGAARVSASSTTAR